MNEDNKTDFSEVKKEIKFFETLLNLINKFTDDEDERELLRKEMRKLIKLNKLRKANK